MASPELTDEQLRERYGRRPYAVGTVALFEPYEWGYRCPKGHGGEYITWSEFNEHIWCSKCNLEYLYYDCTIQQPSWMSKKDFDDFVAGLPTKPKILPGLDRTLDRMEGSV